MNADLAAAAFHLNPRSRLYFSRYSSTPPSSNALREAIQELIEIDNIVTNDWDKIDAKTKLELRLALSGMDPEKPGIHRTMSRLFWSASTVWNIIRYRRETVRYFGVANAVIEKIRVRTSKDVWSEALSDPDVMAGIKQGREEISAGEGITVYPRQR